MRFWRLARPEPEGEKPHGDQEGTQGLRPHNVRRNMASVLTFLVGAMVLAVLVYLNRNAMLEIREGNIALKILGVSVLGTVLKLGLNLLEFNLLSKLIGTKISMDNQLRTTVLASAMNMLPIPGSQITRGAVLHKHGASIKEVGRGTLVVGVTFMLASALTIAISGIGTELPRVFTAGASLSVIFCTFVVLKLLPKGQGERSAKQAVHSVSQLLVVELIFIGVGAVQLRTIAHLLGSTMTILEAAVVTGFASLSLVVSILPAGLGLREVLVGLSSSTLNLQVAPVVAASVYDRIARLITLLGIALLLVVAGKLHPRLKHPG